MLPTVEQIMNHYLYGSPTKANLDSQDIVRDKIAEFGSTVVIDAPEFMTRGAGPIANGAHSEVVSAFFNGAASSEAIPEFSPSGVRKEFSLALDTLSQNKRTISEILWKEGPASTLT